MEEEKKATLEERIKTLEHENVEFKRWFLKLIDAMDNINTTIQTQQKSLNTISDSVYELSEATKINTESIIKSNEAIKTNSEAIIKLSKKGSWFF